VYPLMHKNENVAPLAVPAPPSTPFAVVKSEVHGLAEATA